MVTSDIADEVADQLARSAADTGWTLPLLPLHPRSGSVA
jgi:hypothetical protein